MGSADERKGRDEMTVIVVVPRRLVESGEGKDMNKM